MKLPKAPKIRDCMDTKFDTLSPDTPILEAIPFIVDRRVTGAPVTDDDGMLVGILTEKDCLKLVAVGDDGGDRPEGTVADFMTREVRTLSPEMDIYYAAGRFMQVDFRRYMICNDEGRLIGALTRLDLLRSLKRLMEETPLD